VLLEDGTRFDGEAVGAPGPVTGEVVFNTAMSGYQESMTDPSYARQLITFTYPHIGNYGGLRRGDGVRSDPRPRRDHARRAQPRGPRERRRGLARLAARLWRAGDHRRRHTRAGPSHPRCRVDARRDLPGRLRGTGCRRSDHRRAVDGRPGPGPRGHAGGHARGSSRPLEPPAVRRSPCSTPA